MSGVVGSGGRRANKSLMSSTQVGRRIIVIFRGGEVREMSTRSKFSAASVLALPFFAEPTSVRIVNTFESVFAFAPSLVFCSPGDVYADVG